MSSPPPILAANQPEPGSPPTPLLIGFTRNWPILQQAAVSYLAAGWPARDIYVVDNTGVMDSNERGLLSMQNPSYLNHIQADAAGGKPWRWGLKFYNFDRLALVNVAATRDVGGWDTLIPFYSSDCDSYSRLIMRG